MCRINVTRSFVRWKHLRTKGAKYCWCWFAALMVTCFSLTKDHFTVLDQKQLFPVNSKVTMYQYIWVYIFLKCKIVFNVWFFLSKEVKYVNHLIKWGNHMTIFKDLIGTNFCITLHNGSQRVENKFLKNVMTVLLVCVSY